MPLFETKLGQSGENLALKVVKPVKTTSRDVGDLKTRLMGQRQKKREEHAVEAINEAVKQEKHQDE